MEELLKHSAADLTPKTMPAFTMDDLSAVEFEIAARFKGERGKCAFLRSAAFQRLRLRALYQPELEDEFIVYFNGLKMTLCNRLVTIEWTRCHFEEGDVDEGDTLRKRKRLCDDEKWIY